MKLISIKSLLLLCLISGIVSGPMSGLNTFAQERGSALRNAHAHNDYAHERPFWDAYEQGFCSIEVDIYRVGNELYVGHDLIDLRLKRKLTELYLEPLKNVVQKNGGWVYPDHREPITLLVDIKENGPEVFELLQETLLQYREMICSFEQGAYQKRAVKVIVSGDRPQRQILDAPDRIMAIDGRLSDLGSDIEADLLPLISDRWGSHFDWRGEGEMPENERRRLRKYVTAAHRANRRVRFWATPESPAVWRELLAAEVDFINTDELEKLRAFLLENRTPSPSPAKSGKHEDVVTRIGMIGCHRQDKPAPAFNRYLETVPDIVVWMGDNVYADTEDDIGYIETCYQKMAAQVAFEKLKASTPFVVTWDDHDFGLNNSGKHYLLKDESRKLFRRFWGMEEFIPEDRDGIYHARYFGTGDQRLQLIMLDTRYNRDEPGDEADTLGETQWKWLEEQLKQPARLRLIASGYQILLDREQKMETWSKLPAAKQRLFELIKACQAEGVVFLAGDQHYGEVSRHAEALGYDAVEFMFSGINQKEPHVFNSYRVSPVAHALNAYALIDIQWEASENDPPHLLFRCFDADTNKTELTYRLNFSELQLKK